MKYLLLILSIYSVNSQNLVQNSSFELYSVCPPFNGQIGLAISWSAPLNSSLTSPDYFNACASAVTVGVPQNQFGYQQAYEGNAFAGIVTYNQNENYREYIQTQLLSPLTSGQYYLISFYVSCGENFKYGSNNIGAVITTSQLDANGTTQPINVIPQILNQSIITDTTDWVLVSGTYLAIGNEQYLTIGNFFNNALTQVSVTNPSASVNVAYYYIDKVSVEQLPLGSSDFLQQKYQIVPNPIVDKFTVVKNQSEVITNIELYSQYSRIKILKPSDSVHHVEDLASGVYYLILTFESNRKSVCKIIKL